MAAAAAEEAEAPPNKRETAIVSVETEMVPDRYIQNLLRPSVKTESFYQRYPNLRETSQATDAQINMLIDVQQEMLKQYHINGFAKVGVERYDNGLKRLFILPDQQEEETTAA